MPLRAPGARFSHPAGESPWRGRVPANFEGDNHGQHHRTSPALLALRGATWSRSLLASRHHGARIRAFQARLASVCAASAALRLQVAGSHRRCLHCRKPAGCSDSLAASGIHCCSSQAASERAWHRAWWWAVKEASLIHRDSSVQRTHHECTHHWSKRHFLVDG